VPTPQTERQGKMNNAKIAERLDGMHVSDIKLEIGFLPETTLLSIDGCTRQFPFRGTELLTFCRAVVERVDGEKDEYPDHHNAAGKGKVRG